MKERIAALLLLIATLLSFINLTWAEGFTFRKTKWGMSESVVKSSESLAVFQEADNLLVFKTKVLDDIDVNVEYIFIDNQLVRARYVITESYSNYNDYIEDYLGFKAILEKKYGRPVDDQTIWRDDIHKDNSSNWGFAVSLGQLVLNSTWITSTTEIVNMLSGYNYEITCVVEYKGINLKEREENAIEKKALEDF